MAQMCRKWIKREKFVGFPKRENLEIVEESLPPLEDGEILLEAVYLSVDPYMRYGRVYNRKDKDRDDIGLEMPGTQIARVIQSKNPKYDVNDLVLAYSGWVTHSISNGEKGIHKVPVNGSLPPSTRLGIIGMPGATAYFGLLDICKPIKEGETLLVNAAAGAVGSAVGQIGKIKGMRVVGFAGSDEKVTYLKSLGFDAAYNYKTVPSLEAAIKESCPNGVDVFFDNVGGDFFGTVLPLMNKKGRVAICGAIAEYNRKEPLSQTCPINHLILRKQLNVRGFIILDWVDDWDKAFSNMIFWIQDGDLKYRETVFTGFDKMFDAFMSLFEGTNIGKIIVKI
ncbi:PREDICTED: prostaglandin reductase 1-like [Amphimedon queenslandica]|uniref:Prostaglandin reductase 1 n=2 Tax=Amphimedon queenslandica TaxID=400682 RepID=A0AAN0IGL1_AMPQE|nr:PREDICTED: prostaglandin reductase 1-like [Amphimedon queenslandica]|eukprot:XP_003388652.1 PREDICTED: prostaglandin reductase 1-like [Amphimedon queenslandica]